MEEFTDFCHRTKYHVLKGNSGSSLTVDRKDNTLPYRANNIQALTHAENTAKADNPF